MTRSLKCLAFDTSTDVMSIGVSHGGQTWLHTGAGGAQASTTLIPAIFKLLADAGLALGELDAIAFGRGPGSFTGLRTACAVAQGLAFGANHGAGLPVLPIDSLMAVAEEARFQHALANPEGAGGPWCVTALLDARMDELYSQTFTLSVAANCYAINSILCNKNGDPTAIRPEIWHFEPVLTLNGACARHLLAGNVFEVYADRLPATPGIARRHALPTAAALLRLAPGLVAAGQCVPAAQALPLYVRDKVALTTDERSAVKAAKLLAQP